MEKFLVWFASSPYASFLRTFLAIVIAQAVAEFAKLGTFDFSNYEAWLIAALVASVPALLRVLNPQDNLAF